MGHRLEGVQEALRPEVDRLTHTSAYRSGTCIHIQPRWDLLPFPPSAPLAQALSLTAALAAELPGLTRNSRRDGLAKSVSRAREKTKPEGVCFECG